MKKYLLSIVILFFTTSLCKAQTPILWGLTFEGGAGNGGNIFKTTTNGTVTDKHDFIANSDTNGWYPQGSLFYANNGLLYGLTSRGGANNKGFIPQGTIFSYDISSGEEKDVHVFGGEGDTDGQNPVGSLIQVGDSLLYGMTSGGGISFSGAHGTIFSYNIYTDTEIVLFDFSSGQANNGYIGSPYINTSLIQANNGLLYGTTWTGGAYTAHGGGSLFSYNISTNKATDLHDFGNDTDGDYPQGSLMQASDSLLYGMAQVGGVYDSGMIFSYDIYKNIYNDVYDFRGGKDGKFPNASLIQVNNGLLYGMTEAGGTNHLGTLFSYNILTGKDSILHDFGIGFDGANPQGSLIQASDSLLYGMATSNGADSFGIIFSYNISKGIYTDTHDFNGTDGKYPFGSLIEIDSNTATDISKVSIINNQIIIYPNPSSGQFTVQLNNNQNGYTLEIYNVVGEKIYQSVLSNSQNTINLSSQPEGMYFIYLKSDEGVKVGKVIIAK